MRRIIIKKTTYLRDAIYVFFALLLASSLISVSYAEDLSIPVESPSEAVTEDEASSTPTEDSDNTPSATKKYNVIDIDLGEFQDEMTIGSSQLLSPTAIYVEAEKYDELAALYYKRTSKPLDAANDDEYQAFLNWLFKPNRSIQPYYCEMLTSDQFIRSFSSQNPSIAFVNAMGRIQAVFPGKVKIQIRCGNYTKNVVVTVVEKTPGNSELPTEQYSDLGGSSYLPDSTSSDSGETRISVRDLDFGEYEKKLEVGKSVALNVSVIPSNATNPEISYYSSDEDVATVNGLGRVTGVSAGKVKITAKADGIRRSITLEIEVKTDGIEVDNTYIVLKPDENHSITANVTPEDAPQELTYTSSDESIASVNEDGIITALKPGSTTIVVSNGSAKTIVSVIVNEREVQEAEEMPTQEQVEDERSPLAIEISNNPDGQIYIITGKSVPVIRSDVLMALYGTNKTLTIRYDNYDLSVCGNDILNIENDLNTSIEFISSEDGLYFQPNAGNQLPGRITIKLNDTAFDSSYKWLYQYNTSLKKWQLLSSFEEGVITIDTAGEYSLRQHKEPLMAINWMIVLGCSIVVLIGLTAYIVTKRKYWFW